MAFQTPLGTHLFQGGVVYGEELQGDGDVGPDPVVHGLLQGLQLGGGHAGRVQLYAAPLAPQLPGVTSTESGCFMIRCAVYIVKARESFTQQNNKHA